MIGSNYEGTHPNCVQIKDRVEMRRNTPELFRCAKKMTGSNYEGTHPNCQSVYKYGRVDISTNKPELSRFATG